MIRPLSCSLLFVLVVASSATGDSAGVKRFFDKHCVDCHGPDKQRGDFRIDTLPAKLEGDPAKRWASVRERLVSGEMPPKKRPRPEKADVERVAAWIEARLRESDAARAKVEGRVVLRRLNREEYQNTIRDLLSVEVEVKDLLPEDALAHGFDNVGEALNVSSILLERYLEVADVALDAALEHGPRPRTVKKRYSYLDERRVVGNKKIFLPRKESVVFFSSGYSPSVLSQFRAPATGWYRFRVSASAYQSDEPVTYRVYAGNLLRREGKRHLVGYFDVPSEPKVIEFRDRLEKGDSIQVVPFETGYRIYQIGAANYREAGLEVHWVEAEGPILETWPPASYSRLLGETKLEGGTRDDALRIVRAFLERAYRRPATEAEVEPILALVRAKFEAGSSFEEALRVGLKAVLCSPGFLYLREKPGPLDDYALASRLSYFFWSSMPDGVLLDLAKRGKLNDPDELARQVERMLADPKAEAFTRNFVGQWLDLRNIDFTTPDQKLYPEFDELLQVSMVKETESFFEEILKKDLSVTNFVDSDFAILNERLARHYGIAGVYGQEFRRVSLPRGSVRGGVLGQASVLKVSANGTNTSPVLRGVWVLDRILGKPVPPPPANVPAIEPDIRGATTIRAQLAKHREVESCASCHSKIDPVGFALEGFDVIGGWREFYRVVEKGKRVPVEVRGRRVQYRQGPDVDSSDVLPDGRRFSGLVEFKALLLEDKDQLARCLAEKLATYATGAAPGVSDREEIDRIVEAARKKEYGLRTMVQALVRSDLFRRK